MTKPRVSEQECNDVKTNLLHLRSIHMEPAWNLHIAELIGSLELDLHDAGEENRRLARQIREMQQAVAMDAPWSMKAWGDW